MNEVIKNIDKENAIVLFDDSDINKEYSKKLEDLDRVIDGSSQDKKIVNFWKKKIGVKNVSNLLIYHKKELK